MKFDFKWIEMPLTMRINITTEESMWRKSSKLNIRDVYFFIALFLLVR